MAEKRTQIDQVTPAGGRLAIRLALVDGESLQYHRLVWEGGPLADLFAPVNAHLAEMGWPPVDSAAIEELQQLAKESD